MINLKQEKIEFFEKPVTNDEKEIAALLGQIMEAMHAGNANDFISAFSDSARIVVSKNNPKEMSKKECLIYMARAMERIRRLSYSNTIIRVEGAEATISCLGHVEFRDGTKSAFSRYFKCRKEEGEWRFIEASLI